MKKIKLCYLFVCTFCMITTSLSVEAWRGGTGVARGPNGGTAAWNRGAGVAYGPNGGSAAWNRGAGVAYGPNGGAAAWNRRPPAAPVYGYRPPVYHNGNYGYSSGQVAAAGVAGLAVGAVAGAAIASNNQPSTTVVVQQPATTLAIGTTLSTLPAGGCSVVSSNSVQYYQCGSIWLRTFFGSNGAYYQVVTPPY